MSRLEQIEKMLSDEPGDVFLNFSLAMEYAHSGRQEEAAGQFARVADLDPDYLAAYSQWANILMGLERKDAAKSVLAKGIAAAQRVNDQHAVDQMTKTLGVLSAG
ncbi:MAG: hypothetical protein ACYTBZ_06300 [Planctomycetota bacterium]